MEARADSEIIDIGENGRLRVQLALTDRPWSLPADTLVLPASTSKDLGQLGHRFREACGPQWLSVSTAIDEALKDRKQVKVVEPLLVKLPRLETIAPNLANLILVPIWIPDLSRSDVAVGQIMRLANQNKIKRLILPVIPSGAYNESPVEAAQSAFKEVMTTKNGSLGAVIFVTLSDEARQWLLSQAPSDPGKSSSSPPRHSTATVLLAQELAALGLIPSPTLRNIFAAAGSVARQRQSDNGLLTTSLILFAAIWLGSRPGSGPEGAFLTRLAGAVQNRAGSRYDGLFADYFSSSPKFDSGETSRQSRRLVTTRAHCCNEQRKFRLQGSRITSSARRLAFWHFSIWAMPMRTTISNVSASMLRLCERNCRLTRRAPRRQTAGDPKAGTEISPGPAAGTRCRKRG